MQGKFEVYRDQSGEFRFRFIDMYERVLLSSESYKEKRSAFNGIASIKKNCLIPKRFVKKNSVDGKSYFVLKAANHEIIGKSNSFHEMSECDATIAKVVELAPICEVHDITKRKRKNDVAA